MLLILAVLGLLGCRSPQSEYNAVLNSVNRGDFKSTLVAADAGLERNLGRSPEWEWRYRLLKARILVSRSQGDEALAVLQPLPPPSLLSTDISEQRSLFRGIAHRYSQKFAEAEQDFAEARPLAEPLPPGYMCQFLLSRSALWVDEKEYDKAQADLRNALSIARRNSLTLQEANSLADMARLATSQDHFDEAIDLYNSALRPSRSLKLNGNIATILGNLGWCYFELGDFENALDFYKQGAEESERNGMLGNTAYWYDGVARSDIMLHDYSSAEHISKRAADLARRINNAQSLTLSLNILAELALRAGRFDEAEQYDQEATDLELKGADQFGVLDSLLISGRILASKRRFAEAEALFLRVLNDPKAETSLHWVAEARLAELHDAQNLAARADLEYRKSIDTLEAARASVDRDDLRLSFLSGGIEFYDSYIDFLIRHNRPADALRVADLSRARTLAEGLALSNTSVGSPSSRVSPQQVAKELHASLLFYWIGQKNSYLWVISPKRTTGFTLPPASVIDPLVSSYRKTLLHLHDPNDEGSADGKKLFSLLVEPASKLLPRGSRVIVLPSESLYGLNFETLIVADPQPHFWIEDVVLSTGSSLAMLAATANRPTPIEKSLFLVGDTRPPNPPFAPLPQAASEMSQVRKYFAAPQTKVLEGSAATPSAFLKSNPESYSYLHFVTHGTASHTRPLESAVILSPEGDSYKLYARDIIQHRLNASLVTISACNGAGTRAYSGEGLVGLSWAFLRAGAHNVIGALWDVSDASTPQLMDAFYRELFQGKDPATALRDAKLTLLRSSDPDSVFKGPFYWAPFQLYAGS